MRPSLSMPAARSRRTSLVTEVSERTSDAAAPTVDSISSAITLKRCSCSFARSSASSSGVGSLAAPSLASFSRFSCSSLIFCAAVSARAVVCNVWYVVPPPKPSSAIRPLTPKALSATSSYMMPIDRHICGPRLTCVSSSISSAAALTNSTLSPLTQPSSRRVASFFASTCSFRFCKSFSLDLRCSGVSDASSSRRSVITCVSSPHQSSNLRSPNIMAKTMPGSVSVVSCIAAIPCSSYFLRFALSDSTW
mmetsp:Transcript_41745/g.91669  ORF Transcript_41745/g.91669 Transcript_41745/m.91669 type:complete len:250 (-) Transcript_41745:600-1349(-)